MSFKYNWTFTWKVNEILPAVEKKIAKLQEELAEAEAEEAKTEKPRPAVVEAIEILKDNGYELPVMLRTKLPRFSSYNRQSESSKLRGELKTYKRLAWVLKKEDPHRQYKLDWQDIDELELVEDE